MKAWYVYEATRYCEFAIIVFAETKGKAIVYALSQDEFEDYGYTDMRAKRFPEADGMDKGYKDRLDWDDSDDARFLVAHGWHCNDDVYDPNFCEECGGKDICDYRKDRLEEE